MEFVLSAFSDEADETLDGQIAALQAADIHAMEIRGVDGKNIGQVTTAEAREIRRRLDDAGIAVSAIGSPYGKIKVSDPFEPHLEAMKRTLEVADILGARYFRMFSFFLDGRPHEECRDIVFERMEAMLTAAEQAGVYCCHENEKAIYGDRAAYCLELFRQFGSRLGCVYDPANFIQCGENAQEAFALLRPYITYYHMKDAYYADGTVAPVGEGEGQIAALLRTIADEDAAVVLSLEPHLLQFVGLAQLEEDGGAAIRKHHRFTDNRTAFAYAANALKTTLQQTGYRLQENKYRFIKE